MQRDIGVNIGIMYGGGPQERRMKSRRGHQLEFIDIRRDYLNPQSMENNGPKPLIIAIKAICYVLLGGPGRHQYTNQSEG